MVPPSRLFARVRRFLIVTGLSYVAVVLGYASLRKALGPRPGWAELVDDLEPWAYLPAPVLLALSLLLRSRPLALAAAGLAAVFGLRWGARYPRSTSESARSSTDLTVMTFNTLAWQRAGNDLAASILLADPDVVGLQEIGPRAADHVAEILGDRYPYRFFSPSPDSSGAAVLSRYPIRSSRAFRPTKRSHWWQLLTLDTPFGPLTYLNLHTKIPYVRTWRVRLGPIRFPRSFHVERRQQEIDSLMKMLAEIDGPLIVTGDFNMTERCADYDLVASRLNDAYRAVGRGLGHTFPRVGAGVKKVPAPWPILRLDYVWHSEHFEPAWAERGDAGHSDHHPIVVGLRWSVRAAATERPLPLAAQAM